jgi:biotin carboxylase
MSRLLLLSATTGYQLRSFNEAAARLGVELVFATDRCHSLEDPWQDAALPVRFHEEDDSLRAVVAEAGRQPFVGVLAVGDRPTLLAARVAAALGLPGQPLAAARASIEKLESRRRFAAAGLATPAFRILEPDSSPDSVLGKLPYPCVVKPVSLSGSRGVIRCDDEGECRTAIDRVRRLLARPEVRALRQPGSGRLLIESFIEGREHALEGVLTDGRLQTLAVFDKPDPLDGPYFEETIYVTPTRLDWATEQQLREVVQQAIDALGLRHGPVHAECRVGPQGVVMLEVAARPIGGLCSKVLRFDVPRGPEAAASLEDLLLHHALGHDVSGWRRERAAAAVMMIPIPRRGVLRGVSGQPAALAVPGIEDVRITAKPDQLLEPLPEAGSYLGFIFARAATPGTADAALRTAHAQLTFHIDAAIPIADR